MNPVFRYSVAMTLRRPLKTGLTQQRLQELLDYNADTGVFVWKRRRAGMAKSGTMAGAVKTGGYVQIMVDGQMYLAHRLAWLYVHGCFPKAMIDHINRDPADNRIANLREASDKQNRENCRLQRNNTTGTAGVYWVKRMSKWQAKIGHNRKRVHLGYFQSEAEAISAVKAAKQELFTHWEAN